MTKPRVTATNRLADVIEVVELGRRTGLLLVERGAGEMLEEGAIYFQSGRATYAAMERVRGQDALAVLGGWGGCRFSFDPEAERPAPNLAPASAPAGGPPSQAGWGSSAPGVYPAPNISPRLGSSQPAGRETSGPRSGWFPAPSQSSTPSMQPNSQGSAPSSQPFSQPSGPFSTPWPDPRAGSAPGGTNPNGQSGSSSLPLPQGWPQPGQLGAPITNPGSSGANQATPTGPLGSTGAMLPPELAGVLTPPPPRQAPRADAGLLRRPRRAPTAHDLMAVIQNYGLSRAHRTLLMLADGDHNVLDISRLSSKKIEEVVALLGELEGHGLIFYYA